MCDVRDPILEALVAERPGAFETFYKKYYKLLFLKAFHMVKDEFVAKDLVQECFVMIWEKKLYRVVRSSLESFLFVVIHNNCLQYIKSQQRQYKEQESYAHTCSEEDKTVSEDNFVDRLKTALTDLSQQQQLAIRMFYYEKMSHAEAAMQIGVTLNTFQTHLKRAVKKMRDKIDDRY